MEIWEWSNIFQATHTSHLSQVAASLVNRNEAAAVAAANSREQERQEQQQQQEQAVQRQAQQLSAGGDVSWQIWF